MKGLIEVTATKGKKTLSSEVYGDTENEETLKARLMNRYKVVHGERPQWKVTNIKLNKIIQ